MIHRKLFGAIVVVGVVFVLSGCASLKVEWALQASYSSENAKKASNEQIPDPVRP